MGERTEPSNAVLGRSGNGDGNTPAGLVARYGLDADTAATLVRFGFDPYLFDRLRRRLEGDAADRLRANQLADTDRLRPCSDADLVPLPPPGSRERDRLAEAGAAAIAAGQVGVLMLAGGMATRFGGGVKALAEVDDGVRFIDAKLADVRRAAQAAQRTVPLWLMTSFASHDALDRWATDAIDEDVEPQLVPQFVSMRLQLGGQLAARDGAALLYAPGHGDAPWAMRRAGVLDAFVASGGRHVFVSNVDNVAATLDPGVIGAHLAAGNPLTCEVARGSDTGGAPWWVDGHLQVVEAFRLPPSRQVPEAGCVNTNSLVVDAQVLADAQPLTYFEVHKQMRGSTVVQFERLIGELSAQVPTTMLAVKRDGSDGRFQPVKDAGELAARQPAIRATLAAKGLAQG